MSYRKEEKYDVKGKMKPYRIYKIVGKHIHISMHRLIFEIHPKPTHQTL